jgi:hypothetical protein
VLPSFGCGTCGICKVTARLLGSETSSGGVVNYTSSLSRLMNCVVPNFFPEEHVRIFLLLCKTRSLLMRFSSWKQRINLYTSRSLKYIQYLNSQ